MIGMLNNIWAFLWSRLRNQLSFAALHLWPEVLRPLRRLLAPTPAWWERPWPQSSLNQCQLRLQHPQTTHTLCQVSHKVLIRSKCYNSKADKDISMKPTANGHKFPKFSMAGSRAKISESTFELFYLEQWTQLAQKFWPLLRDPGPG